jgi:hypothetical protein
MPGTAAPTAERREIMVTDANDISQNLLIVQFGPMAQSRFDRRSAAATVGGGHQKVAMTTPDRHASKEKELIMTPMQFDRSLTFKILIRVALTALSLSGMARARAADTVLAPQSGSTYNFTTGGGG